MIALNAIRKNIIQFLNAHHYFVSLLLFLLLYNMPEQPESTSYYLLRSRVFTDKAVLPAFLDSPIQYFREAVKYSTSVGDANSASMSQDSSASRARSAFVSAHEDMIRDWNLSNHVWKWKSSSAATFRSNNREINDFSKFDIADLLLEINSW